MTDIEKETLDLIRKYIKKAINEIDKGTSMYLDIRVMIKTAILKLIDDEAKKIIEKISDNIYKKIDDTISGSIKDTLGNNFVFDNILTSKIEKIIKEKISEIDENDDYCCEECDPECQH